MLNETTDDPTIVRERLVAASGLTDQRRDVAGIDTAVLEGGDGPPLVLLHGQGEFGAVWLPVLRQLARRNRLVVPDLPGHGASGVGDGPVDVPAVVAWLDALIDQTCGARHETDVERPVVAGHLLGGAIAARHAVEHGDRLAHLVLVDTLGLGWFRPKLRFALPMVAFLARPTAASRDRLFDQCFVDHDAVAATTDHWEAMRDYALAGAQNPMLQTAMKTMMPKVGLPPIPREDLAGLRVPVTLIHGRDDLQVGVATAQAASDAYGWPLHVVDGVRDDPAVERPTAFLAALADALGNQPHPASAPDPAKETRA